MQVNLDNHENQTLGLRKSFDPPLGEELSLFSAMGMEDSGGDGVLMVDLDDGAFALFRVLRYLYKIIKAGSFDAVINDINDDAVQLVSKPHAWLREQAVPKEPVDAMVGLGLSAIVLPLSILAIKAGVEETSEALDKHWELKAEHVKIEKNLQSLQRPLEPDATQLHANKIATQSLEIVDSAIQHNSYSGAIGLSSMVSGLTLFIRVVGETTLQILNLVLVNSGALLMATTVIGAVGIIYFGPLAALAAVGLGGFFVHQTRKVGEELAEDRQLIQKVSSLDVSMDHGAGTTDAYHAFIERKLTSREDFTTRFKNWNFGFFTGACFSAMGAAGNAALGIAALSGAIASLATPAGLAVILGLGITGGILMVACCWQFIKWGGKSKKHQAYRLPESELPFLGRCFDSIQTQFAIGQPEGKRYHTASTLRAALYRFVSERDTTRQKFLQERAVDLGKFRAWEKRATDSAPPEWEGKQKEGYKNVLAYFYFVGTYFGNLFKWESHQVALEKAREAHEHNTDNVTAYGLAGWFDGKNFIQDNEVHEKMQRDLLADILREQQLFLVDKRETLSFLPHLPENLENDVKETFEKAMKEVDADLRRLVEINILLDNISSEPLAPLKMKFLQLHNVNTDNLTNENINECLADYLITGLSDELTTTRGILFDMHRRSVQQQCAPGAA